MQAQLGVLDGKVEQAAEAFNGARYHLGLVQQRIVENRRVLTVSRRDLTTAQDTLARRLRDIYRQSEPSLAQVHPHQRQHRGPPWTPWTCSKRLGTAGPERGRATSAPSACACGPRVRSWWSTDRQAAQQVEATQRERARVQGLLRRAPGGAPDGAKGELSPALIAAEQERQRARRPRGSPASGPRPPQQRRARRRPRGPRAPPPQRPVAERHRQRRAARVAMQYLGVPYVWGGASPRGFDCSGLASYAYAQIGKSVPHYTGAIWASFPQVPSGPARAPATWSSSTGARHVGIYIGNGQFVHAPHTGDVVRIANLADRGDYVGAVRP